MKAAGLAAALLLAAAPSRACDVPVTGEGWRQLESSRYIVAYRPQPAPAVGQLFALDVALCVKTGGMPDRLRVDAYMPAHRHGMNYEPGIQPVAAGRYRAEALLLHMPGRWELIIELNADGRTERLSAPFDLDG